MALSQQYFNISSADSSYHMIIFGIIFGVIIFLNNISSIFLRNPMLLHTRKSGIMQRNKIHCIGHRGSKDDGIPENTIAAFKDSCLVSGSDTVELDVWLTKDGEVIVHHNETVSELSTSTSPEANRKVYKITESCYKDLPLLINDTSINYYDRIKSYSSLSIHTTEINSNSDDKIKHSNSSSSSLADDYQKIPTLKQVFENIPNHIFIIVEFSQNSDALIQKVHQLIQTYKRQEATIWFSLGLFLCTALYTHLRARGISVFVLGIETSADVSKAQQIGATAVLTDKPSWLVKYVKESKIEFARVPLKDDTI